ncbi:uncharacterized protein LOC107853613 isoform X4 [Capsicum annuum]|uniref:uncharacterized protein LOC107853613 isoform X4 n=1 Tax=Capsicum annuum TaxID=4072 RepID=UPI0007BF02AC|nr:uncharacterized protein LOC107853613 isoform X4 [Capsicum annuum]
MYFSYFVFNYISNLSPIQPVKSAPVVQDFPRLNSPRTESIKLVGKEPASSTIQRSQRPQLSSEAFCGMNENYNNVINNSDGTRVSVSLPRSRVNPFVQKISDNSIFVHEQSGSSIRCVHEFLLDVSNSESGNPSNSTNTSLKVTDKIPQSPNSAGDSKESVANIASKDARQDEIPEDAARVVVEQAEKDNKGLCTEIVPYLLAHSSSPCHYGDRHMAQLSGVDRTMLDEASNIRIKSLETARDCRNDSDKINTMPVAPDESIVQHDSQTKNHLLFLT